MTAGEPPGGDLLRRVEETFEHEAVPALAEYTAVRSLSPGFDAAWAEHGELRRAAELIARWCAGRAVPGAHVEVIELEQRSPVVLAEIPASDPARAGSTLLYGHYDKQPALGDWSEGLAPFEAVRRGDRLYGRGTADDGYAAFAAFTALEALAAAGTGHGRCVLLVEGSEESGSCDLPAYLEALSERVGEPSLVVCLDSGAATYDRLWLTASLRGLIGANLRVEVLSRGVHSGAAGGAVPSSFRVLRQLLGRLESAETGEILLAALRSPVPAGRRAEIEDLVRVLGEKSAGSFPTLEGVRLAGASAAERIELRTWAPALEVTGIAGIPPLADAGNVLRPFTEAHLSIRLPPDVDPVPAARALATTLERDPPDGARVSCRIGELGRGFQSPPPAPWLSAALEQASQRNFGQPPGVMGEGGSIPFLATLAERLPSAQFVVTGVLGPDSNAHGPDEFLHIPTAAAVTACVAEVLAAAP